jgi:sulfide dehydrogenase [flavocytochrome c] flavoprotein chain
MANSTHPHAWKAGPQTLMLKKQLEGMKDGQTFIISVPPGPFRCPPGPYERASQVASYFKHHGMNKSKVLIADANDSFSKKGLFEQAWKRQYPGMIEWVAGAAGGKIVKFDAKTNTVSSDFNDYKGDVVNIIPPHHAGNIARNAGLTNAKGWCDVDMLTMESPCRRTSGHRRQLRAWRTAGLCAPEIRSHGQHPGQGRRRRDHRQAQRPAAPEPFFVNTCYSITAPEWGFSVVHVYRQKDGKLVYITEAGGISPVNMDMTKCN